MNFRKYVAVFLAVVMCVSMLATGAWAEEGYTSTTKGFGGDVTVTLTVDGGKVVSLTAEGPNESTDYGAKGIVYFNKQFEGLVGAAVAELDTDAVDAYTGATTTSNAVMSALSSVLAEAKGSSIEMVLADGTYTELEWGFSLDTQLPVTVEIKDNTIVSIVADLENGGETTHIAGTAVENMIPRIIAEQSLAVDAVAGATSSSNAIKRGVSDALIEAMTAAGMDSQSAQAALTGWYTAPSYLKTGAEPVVINTQVVVVGAGGTGCLAALQSQKTGADTLVIETSAKYGGTGALTCGPMTINSPAEVADFGNRDLVDADALYIEWLGDIGAAEDSTAAEIISNFMGMSGYDIDWMNSMGFQKFVMATPFKYPAHQIWCTYDGWNAGKVHGDGNTHGYFNDLMATYAALGGETMFETTGKALLIDEAGNVVGVEAVGFDGQVYNIYADAVVLATGGYAGSSEYLKEFTLSDDTGVYQTYGVKTNVGTAITMARQIDGRIADNVDIVMAHFSAPEQRIHEFSPADNQIPTAIIVNQGVLDVNTNGERFINEAAASDDAGDETNRYFSIIGSDQLDAIKANGFTGTTNGMYLNPGAIAPATPVENIYTVLDFCVEAGFVWKAESIEELAAAISADTAMPMAELAASVARYNELCAAGADEDFGKDAAFMTPITGSCFYAVEATPILYSTCSSVTVDKDMHLVKNSGEIVPNLFVGGMDSMGAVLSDEYIDYGGVAQSWTFYSGRLSGMNAAEYALAAAAVSEGDGYTVNVLANGNLNVVGTAPVAPEYLLANGDLAENGLNYIVISVPCDASSAVITSVAPIAGSAAVRETNTEAVIADGMLTYALQVNDSTVTSGGVVITAVLDDGSEAAITVNTDFLALASDTVSENVTAQAVEAAAADADLAGINFINIGTDILKAAADENGAVYEITGTVAENSAVTAALGLDAEAGEHYAAVLLDAPEGFENGTFTVTGAVSFAGNDMSVARETIEAVNGGAVYVQQFLPAVYAYAGFWGGENLVAPGTLSELGVTVCGNWTNGSETKAAEYKLIFADLYMDFEAMDMTAELNAIGVEETAEIKACGVHTYTVSETGTVDVMLEAPDPFFAYMYVAVNGEVLDCSAGYVVVPVELVSGENTVTAIWAGMGTFWGPGANYPVEYTFICE